MRRALTITLLLLFGLPLLLPAFAGSAAEASLPACCRRDGQHHCVMLDTGETSSGKMPELRGRCPYGTLSFSVAVLPSFVPPVAASIFAGITRHPTPDAQTNALRRISFDRSRQKRGPPALTL